MVLNELQGEFKIFLIKMCMLVFAVELNMKGIVINNLNNGASFY